MYVKQKTNLQMPTNIQSGVHWQNSLGGWIMIQKHFEYTNDEGFISKLNAVKSEYGDSIAGYSQILSASLDTQKVKHIVEVIHSVFPEISCIANSTAGNIADCDEASPFFVSFNIFERSSTKFDIFQYNFDEMGMAEIAGSIRKEAEKRSWIKAIEIYYTVPKISTSYLCDELAGLDNSINIFGGIVCSTDITSTDSFVYSDKGGFMNNAIVGLFIGGEELYVSSLKISGWKPIGRTFRVTSSEGSVLKELSGVPAYDIYKKYLNIKNDENFFINALDFPMMYENNNTTIVRASASSNEDGSINMSANIENGKIMRLSYGEPKTILEVIHDKGIIINAFEPEVMHIFSCAARKAFWSEHNPTYELLALKDISKCTGFFSHGEFLREMGYLNQHNLTLVIASFREGEKGEKPYKGHVFKDALVLSSKLPLAARMATFIRETSYELEQINSRLEIMNEQLKDVATTDSLTGLDNRLAFDSMLSTIDRESSNKDNWIMYMFDVNGLKYVNDTFGHPAGDELIKSSARVLEQSYGKCGSCYRIGGDEFVVLINESDEQIRKLERLFSKKLQEYNSSALYHISIAKGKSKLIDNRGVKRSISDWKMDADLSMYRNKAAAHKQNRNSKDENLKQLISCLVTVEEAKDPYTAYHSDRVCRMSEIIAGKIGLTEESINMISDAAALHDIGKVGISDSVLRKPGRLTDYEYSQIKEHPVIGGKILMKSNYMQEFVQIVVHHHERFDGHGYPDGLKGDEIPLGARIIAIADSIDAMTSKRVYRDALSLEACKGEIEKNLGLMYDPAIGKIVLDNWAAIEEVVMQNPKNLLKHEE